MFISKQIVDKEIIQIKEEHEKLLKKYSITSHSLYKISKKAMEENLLEKYENNFGTDIIENDSHNILFIELNNYQVNNFSFGKNVSYHDIKNFVIDNEPYLHSSINLFDETKNLFLLMYKRLVKEKYYLDFFKQLEEHGIELLRVCPYCGIEPLRYTKNKLYGELDHISPKAKVDNDLNQIIDIPNLLPVCSNCNGTKHQGDFTIYNPYFINVNRHSIWNLKQETRISSMKNEIQFLKNLKKDLVDDKLYKFDYYADDDFEKLASQLDIADRLFDGLHQSRISEILSDSKVNKKDIMYNMIKDKYSDERCLRESCLIHYKNLLYELKKD